MTRSIIPFGPQHPVLPEPLHLKLVVEDETVVEAVPALGFIHRGLEGLATRRDFHQMVYVVERVCGICSCIHALCYCNAIEKLMGLEVPKRAQYLRIIWSELHRAHSHLLWLGLFADAFGFESLFMQLWKVRERIMDINEATAGNRVIVSTNIIGGVRRDISQEWMLQILRDIDDIEKQLKPLYETMSNDYSVKQRTVGVGVLSKEQAHQLGAVGPTLRGSGWAQDCRQLNYEVFGELDFAPVVEHDGDCYARNKVRFREVFQSLDLVRQAINKIPQGDLAVKVKGNPEGEITFRVEQPRGELFYYVKCNGEKNPERVRIRTPTFANIPPLLAMLPGAQLASVPVIALSIDPCISCTER
ncbi:nickel-dependent hydrogenase large subunit [Desulfovibrio sp. OttesenSCG-928-G11]|nr:nickel-dependent hydrogenase large subunit [Desulfovibrio sp. OttesenSCG-928-G11]